MERNRCQLAGYFWRGSLNKASRSRRRIKMSNHEADQVVLELQEEVKASVEEKTARCVEDKDSNGPNEGASIKDAEQEADRMIQQVKCNGLSIRFNEQHLQ